MRFFDEFDVMQLQEVAEDLQWDEAQLLRVVDGNYAVAATINCRLFPPGAMRGEYRSVVPHLRGMALGEIETSVADADRLKIIVKDRFRLPKQGNRLFEVGGILSPRSQEIRRKHIVREINLPERRLWMAMAPDGFKGPSRTGVLPELVQVLPVPMITDKPVQAVSEGQGAVAGAVKLSQILIDEVALAYFAPANLSRLLYYLIVTSDIVPTPQEALDGKFVRYRANGSPSYDTHRWSGSGLYPWSVSVVASSG